MSMIKVSCPSCKSALKIAEEKLMETQGRVVCHECQHIFRLVKKSKKNAPPAQTLPANAKKASKSPFDDIGDNDPIFPNDDFLEEPKTKLKNKKSNKIKPLADLPPLHYRIPKAEAKTPFAEVNQQSPVAFNLLDYKTANQQIPQVNINPVSNEPIDSKNNITINTGSLVFTVMGDGQANANTLPSDGAKFNEIPMTNQQAVAMLAAATGTRNDLNWTIAVIAALISLIVQLFYLVLMLS